MTAYSTDVLVVGGGTFGTALASLLAENQRRVELWVRRAEQAEEINTQHTNRRYLKEHPICEAVTAVTELGPAVRRAGIVLMVVPSRAARDVARQLGEHIRGDQYLVHAVKGFEVATFQRISQILRQETCALKIGVLSGPTLALEVLARQPTGAVVASAFDEVVAALQWLFGASWFRIYGARDVLGTEIGGSFKNIIALAAGFARGLELGSNSQSLLLTRGLAEMMKLGAHLGARLESFSGLAGVGDLVTTCGSELSRNNRLGKMVAEGRPLQEALDEMGQVAEGVPTTQAVHPYAERAGLELPIVRGVYRVLFENLSVSAALDELMALPTGAEMAGIQMT